MKQRLIGRDNKKPSTMKSIFIICIAISIITVDARSWWDLEIPAIESIKNDNPLYYSHGLSKSLLIEDVSLFAGSDVSYAQSFKLSSTDRTVDNNNISDYSSINTVITPSTIEKVQLVNNAPTTNQPTYSPSASYEALNGNCPSNYNLYRLWLYDTGGDGYPFGDGWGSTKLIIKETILVSRNDINDALFIGTLDMDRGVVKIDISQADSSKAHWKNGINPDRGYYKQRRGLVMTKGGTISGPSGSITWDKDGNVVYGSGLGDINHSKNSDGESGTNNPHLNPQGNTPESGLLDGSSGTIQWGDSNINKSDVEFERDGSTSESDEEEDEIIYNESEYLCLKQDVSYTVEVSGGTFLEETSWEISRVKLGSGDNQDLVASGTGAGLGVCTFCLDGSCEKTCDGTAQVIQPTGIPSTQSPSNHPSSSPIGTPTISPSKFITKKPVEALRMVPIVPEEDSYAAEVKEYLRIQNVILTASPSSKQAMSATDTRYQAFDADEESAQFKAFEWIYTSSDISRLSDEQIVQRWILSSLYFATNGDGWIENEGWIEPTVHECNWYGVTCLGGEVSKLELSQNHLVGEIKPEISLLKDTLYVLSLGNDFDAEEEEKNEFIMALPSSLGDLPALTYLNLENCGLRGSIPRYFFSEWTHLESLYLNGNDITGTLPNSIQHLRSIEVLWLGGNNLSGSIISEIGDLTSLKDLNLENNYRKDVSGQRGFITSVPAELNQLTNLESLSLADNSLSGLVPNLSELISLRRLQLSGNYFEGQLPPALGRLEMLEELDLSYNWLSSTIPQEYGNMISLTSLKLSSNYNDEQGYFTWGIKSTIPSELGELKNLRIINLSDNYITGTLIKELGQLPRLQTMHLQNNDLNGPIPTEYSNCASLREILLQDNSIDGELFSMPEEICHLPQLELARVDCEVSCSCCLSTC